MVTSYTQPHPIYLYALREDFFKGIEAHENMGTTVLEPTRGYKDIHMDHLQGWMNQNGNEGNTLGLLGCTYNIKKDIN